MDIFKPKYIRRLVLGPRCFLTKGQIIKFLDICANNLKELHLVTNESPPLPQVGFYSGSNEIVPWGAGIGVHLRNSHDVCCENLVCSHFTAPKKTLNLYSVTLCPQTLVIFMSLLHDKYKCPKLEEFHLHSNLERTHALGLKYFDFQHYMPNLTLLCLSHVISLHEVYSETKFYAQRSCIWPKKDFKCRSELKFIHLLNKLQVLNLPGLQVDMKRLETTLEPFLTCEKQKKEQLELAQNPRLLTNILSFGNNVRITFKDDCGSSNRMELLTFQN